MGRIAPIWIRWSITADVMASQPVATNAKSLAIDFIVIVDLHEGEDGGVITRPLDGMVLDYFGFDTAQGTAMVYVVYAVLPTGRIAWGPGAAGMS